MTRFQDRSFVAIIEIEHLCTSQDGLGETPIWFEEEKSLYWADHVAPFIAEFRHQTPLIETAQYGDQGSKSVADA